MPVTTKLRDAIRSSRQRMQAGLSRSVEKSGQKTGATKLGRRLAGHTDTGQQKYIDGGKVVLRPK